MILFSFQENVLFSYIIITPYNFKIYVRINFPITFLGTVYYYTMSITGIHYTMTCNIFPRIEYEKN